MFRLLRWCVAITGSSLIAGLAATAPAQAATTPTIKVTTGAASAVSSTTETLTGTIDNGGTKAEWQFQYGKSMQYGTATPVKPLAGKAGAQMVKVTIAHLKTNTVYHYRLVAVTGSGSSLKRTFGKDATFKSGGTGLLRLIPSSLTVTHGMLATPLTCDSTLACKGKFSVGTHARDAKTKKMITAVCVSGQSFTIKAHQTKTVKAKVLKGCLALLKHNRRITAKVTSYPRTGQHALVKKVKVLFKS